MNKLRRLLYRLASLLGWVNAIKRGKVPQRIVRVALTKRAQRTINRWIP